VLTLGAIAFAAPWALVALVGLPILWWLLKVTPPAPRLLRFPAIRLLFGLRQDEQTPARTPLWLILLRMTIATLIILGLAHPLLNPGAQFSTGGPAVLVIDDGWASARGWPARLKALDSLIARAERAGKPMMVLATSEPADGGPIVPSKLLTPAEARRLVQAMVPNPWPGSRMQALAALTKMQFEGRANIFWLADGVEDGKATEFANALQRLGNLTVMRDTPGTGALALPPPETTGTGLTVRALRRGGDGEQAFWLRGADERGRLLLRERIVFADGKDAAELALAVPAELRNRITRLEIEDGRSAGTVALLDERWRRRPVGIVTSITDKAQVQPLLSEVYYLERALNPYAEVRKGPVAKLLARRLAVLVVPDSSELTESDREAIANWMARGGTVARFAGPRLGEKPDKLTPVRLRAGDRALGGTMSWAQPATLAPFDDTSPFAGLKVPEGDIMVRRQVLAEPSLDLPNKTWARLADGTPLVTGAERGRGRVVLVHTTANTNWSDLVLSGLFVEMLRRVVGLSHGVAGSQAGALPPVLTLDGFGRFGDPSSAAQPLPAALATLGSATGAGKDAARAAGIAAAPVPGPTRPPGFYGNESSRFALNLAAGMTQLTPIGPLPAGVRELALAATKEADLKPWLLAVALALLLADMWIALMLRGLAPAVGPLRAGGGEEAGARAATAIALATVLATASLVLVPPALAQDTSGGAALSASEKQTMAATFETRLAYVRTGDSRLDEVSRAGLRGLSRTLTTRTSVEPKLPMAVDVETDELSFFPFLYWPISETQPLPSRKAREKLTRYLRNGGMILFDTRDARLGNVGVQGTLSAAGPGAAKLREIVRGLQVPALIPVPKGHILTKAFYLLKEFPGRWSGGTLWVERATGHANDGVSSVVIGANDFAAAWATDQSGQPLYPVVPGGDRQREMANRFGVNLVMYALTGNYKSDQVHVPAILERLGQ
jgi:hypothetical protein